MPSITPQSKVGIKHVFKTTNLYRVNKFPLVAALQDSGIPLEESVQFLRNKWLNDQTGFYSTVDQYSTRERRISELHYYGDFLNSLRQRINITHELVECDFNSNLPVHVSVEPRDSKASVELDLTDIESCRKFRFIIHPGQTRVQGSLFLQDELKNVILYIKKDYQKIVSIKKYKFITPILGERRLIESYRPSTFYNEEISLPNLEYDFFLPNQPSGKLGVKKHVQLTGEQIPILKCNTIKEVGPNTNYHSSEWYIFKSFIQADKFFKVLYNNLLNVYADNTKEAISIQKLAINHRDNILDRGNYRNGNNVLGCRTKLYNSVVNKTFTKDEKLFLTKYQDLLEDHAPSNKFTPTKTYNKLGKLSISDIVKKNGYKGFVIIHLTKKSKWTRDYYELLFTIPPSIDISRDKDSTILIVNCESPHWKDKKIPLREYIMTEKFVK